MDLAAVLPDDAGAEAIVVGGQLLYRDLRGVRAVNLETGKTQWESIEGVSPERIIAGLPPQQVEPAPTRPFPSQGSRQQRTGRTTIVSASSSAISESEDNSNEMFPTEVVSRVASVLGLSGADLFFSGNFFRRRWSRGLSSVCNDQRGYVNNAC